MCEEALTFVGNFPACSGSGEGRGDVRALSLSGGFLWRQVPRRHVLFSSSVNSFSAAHQTSSHFDYKPFYARTICLIRKNSKAPPLKQTPDTPLQIKLLVILTTSCLCKRGGSGGAV